LLRAPRPHTDAPSDGRSSHDHPALQPDADASGVLAGRQRHAPAASDEAALPLQQLEPNPKRRVVGSKDGDLQLASGSPSVKSSLLSPPISMSAPGPVR
jgi:hypothetical protein